MTYSIFDAHLSERTREQKQTDLKMHLVEYFAAIPKDTTHLILSNLNLTPCSMQDIRQAFSHIPPVTTLEMVYFNLGPRSAPEKAEFWNYIPNTLRNLKCTGFLRLPEEVFQNLCARLPLVSLEVTLHNGDLYLTTRLRLLPQITSLSLNLPDLLSTDRFCYLLQNLPRTLTKIYFPNHPCLGDSHYLIPKGITSLGFSLQYHRKIFNQNYPLHLCLPPQITDLRLFDLDFVDLEFDAQSPLPLPLTQIKTLSLTWSELLKLPLNKVSFLSSRFPCLETLHILDEAGEPKCLSFAEKRLLNNFGFKAGLWQTIPSLVHLAALECMYYAVVPPGAPERRLPDPPIVHIRDQSFAIPLGMLTLNSRVPTNALLALDAIRLIEDPERLSDKLRQLPPEVSSVIFSYTKTELPEGILSQWLSALPATVTKLGSCPKSWRDTEEYLTILPKTINTLCISYGEIYPFDIFGEEDLPSAHPPPPQVRALEIYDLNRMRPDPLMSPTLPNIQTLTLLWSEFQGLSITQAKALKDRFPDLEELNLLGEVGKSLTLSKQDLSLLMFCGFYFCLTSQRTEAPPATAPRTGSVTAVGFFVTGDLGDLNKLAVLSAPR